MQMTLAEARKLLGVRSITPLERITAAYRRRMFEVHPDRNPGDPTATDKVHALNEAYQIAKRNVGVELAGTFFRSAQAYDPFVWGRTYSTADAPPNPRPTVFEDLMDEIRQSARSESGRGILDQLFETLSDSSARARAEGRVDLAGLGALLGMGILTVMLRVEVVPPKSSQPEKKKGPKKR